MKSDLVKQSVRDGRSVIEYQTQPGEMMDGLVLKNCKEGKVLGALPMGAIYENQHNYMYAYTDNKESLSSRISGVVSQKVILTAFESIVWTLDMFNESGINLAYVILNPDYIFIDEETGKAKLVCIPAKMATGIEDEIVGFFREILANAVYLNSENGNYVAKLLSALNKDFELKSFLRTIHGLMMDANIEIIEETLEEVSETTVPKEELPIIESEPVVEVSTITEPGVVEATPIMPEAVEAETLAPMEELVQIEPVVTVPEIETKAEEGTVKVPEEEPIAESRVTMGVVPEDDIEFEPIPEELNAKIERMNHQTVSPQPIVQPAAEPQPIVQPVAEPQPIVQPAAEPQPIVQPTAEPQPIVQPAAEPQPVVQPAAELQPVVQPAQPQPVVQPAQPQPTVQPVAPQPVVQPAQPQPVVQPAQPQPVVQPAQPQPIMQQEQSIPGPKPMYMPSDVGIPVPPQQKQPSPHLIRVKTGEYILLPEGEFVIGKSVNGVNYTVTDNTAVSRVHCTIYKKNTEYFVRDERSTNSTYVNGEQVLPGSEHLLTNNCKLNLGDEEFTFQLW